MNAASATRCAAHSSGRREAPADDDAAEDPRRREAFVDDDAADASRRREAFVDDGAAEASRRREASADDAMIELEAGPLRRALIRHLVRALELDPEDAAVTVEHWIRSERAGKPCHGLIRALHLCEPGRYGPYGGVRAPAPTRLAAGRLHVDGTGALGYPILGRLVEHGCREAIEVGHCVATGHPVYPSGALGDWARIACGRGCGLILMGGSPARVAAPEGGGPLLGTNPICVGLPTAPYAFVADAATSAITHGDLLLADRAGVDLPAGVALDRRGGRTRAPEEVAALLPIGASHKAFALSMAVELLTCLGGGIPGSPRPTAHGVFAVFLGPDLVAQAVTHSEQLAGFQRTGARIPGWASAERASATAAGDRLVLARATHDALVTLVGAAEVG